MLCCAAWPSHNWLFTCAAAAAGTKKGGNWQQMKRLRNEEMEKEKTRENALLSMQTVMLRLMGG